MRVHVVQLGYGDAEPPEERVHRVVGAGGRAVRRRPGGAARALGTGRVRLPAVGRARRAGRRADGDGDRARPRARSAPRCTPARRRAGRRGPGAARRAAGCGTPRCCSARTATGWPPTARSTASGSAAASRCCWSPARTWSPSRSTSVGARPRRPGHLLRPAVPGDVPPAARRRREVLVVPAAWPAAGWRTGRCSARARAVENQSVVVAVQHRRHARRGADGRLQPGGRCHRRRARRGGEDEQVLAVDIDLTR